jgi:hypothetical protein
MSIVLDSIFHGGSVIPIISHRISTFCCDLVPCCDLVAYLFNIEHIPYPMLILYAQQGSKIGATRSRFCKFLCFINLSRPFLYVTHDSWTFNIGGIIKISIPQKNLERFQIAANYRKHICEKYKRILKNLTVVLIWIHRPLAYFWFQPEQFFKCER